MECGGGGGVEVLLKERQSREGGTFDFRGISVLCDRISCGIVVSGVICTIGVMGADD